MNKDTVIANGLVIDGTGTPPFKADVLLRGGKIEDIGSFGPVGDAQRLDADGQYVTPGFVDIHRHCDYAVFKDGFGVNELTQGVTTAVSGLCGMSPFPAAPPNDALLRDFLTPLLGTCAPGVPYDRYAAYADAVCQRKPLLTVKQLIGSCSVRIAVKGFSNAPFTPDELAKACGYVSEALENGALGLSMGLMYIPEYYSACEDLIALARTAARYGGVLAMHIRNEGERLPEAIREAAEIAEAAGISLEVSHFKSCGATDRHGKLLQAIEIIETFRRRGVDIHADFYPYTGGATTIVSLVPPCCMKETPAETFSYFSTKAGADALRHALLQTHDHWDNYLLALGFERIIISSVRNKHNERYVGRTLRQITDENPHTDAYTFLSELIADEEGQACIFIMSMSPDDVDTVAALPWTMVASDALYPGTGRPHPRAYGTFPRILRDFVGERSILPLHTAIHKMTEMPALKMGLTDRGCLRKGAAADLCVFDLARIADHADFTRPPEPAEGMSYVLRGGEIMKKG